MGAGDDVPQAIRQLGCDVTLLTESDLSHGDLTRFDAIVTGVRAFNTRPDLRANYQRLFDYASNGGTLIVQYNVPEGGAPPQGAPPAPGVVATGQGETTQPAPAQPAPALPPAVAAAGDGGLLAHIGPYPIRIARNDRVTVEEAPITFPNPDLRLLHVPNQITSADFDGWVQERGLYFADRVGPSLPERARIARSRRNASSGRHAVRTHRQGRVYLLRLRLVPRTAGGSSRRLSHVREHAERGPNTVKKAQ